MPQRLVDKIQQMAWAQPTQHALRDGVGVMTYGELVVAIDEAGRGLRRGGLRAGEAVALGLRDGRGFILGAFAIWSQGGIVVPLAASLSPAERRELLETAGCRWLLDETNRLERIGEGSDAARQIAADAAFVRGTSGTTGTSKGVVIGAAAILDRLDAANAGLSITSDDVVLCVLPMAYHFLVSIVLYLRFGATLVLGTPLAGDAMLDACVQTRATVIYAAPTHVRMLAACPPRGGYAPLRLCVSTSAGLQPDISRAFRAAHGLPVTQGLGIIEVGLPILNGDAADEAPEAIGRVQPGYEVLLLDEAMNPTEGAGQLAIRGPGMFAGYLEPRARASEVLRDGWFLTGDMATRDAGGLYRLQGRLKSVINVAGNKAFAEEVEAMLEKHPSVRLARAFGRAHPQFGELVAAEVVLDSPVDPEELIRHCRHHLSPYKVPQSVAVVESIALTPSGKVRRA